MNKKLIISDAGPLIVLAKTGYLHVLRELFRKVKIPQSVSDELKLNTSMPGANALRDAITIKKWIEVHHVVGVPDILTNSLDQGEAEAILLAKTEGLVLLIDEKKGRGIARKENVRITGTGAVLIAAKQKGIIQSVSTVLNALINCGYRISMPMQKKILQLANEVK